jgi:hypothetical protein
MMERLTQIYVVVTADAGSNFDPDLGRDEPNNRSIIESPPFSQIEKQRLTGRQILMA